MDTIKAMAQSALDVQTACNLSGVAQSFADVMMGLRRLPECAGTEWANRHPIAVLYATQITHLATGGMIDGEFPQCAYTRAYAECARLAGQGQAEEPRQVTESEADDDGNDNVSGL